MAFALAAAVTALASLLPASASARTTRLYQGSFGSFPSRDPRGLAVDQSTGDVYAVSSNSIFRFTSSGAPKNFTSGDDAGSNVLTGFSGASGVAVDNSGGPLDGNFYVINGGDGTVDVFAPSGASLGALDGSGAPGDPLFASHASPCGIAVDQSTGDLYLSQMTLQYGGVGKVWRYSPSPSGSISDADYTVTGITVSHPCQLAADAGTVYVVQHSETGSSATPGVLQAYSRSAFAVSAPQVNGTPVETGVNAIGVDPQNGDLYVDMGNRVRVLDSSRAFQYEFGFSVYFGSDSAGVAVDSAASGAATKAYVADPFSGSEVDVFGAVALAPTYTHTLKATIGNDGSGSTSFGAIGQLGFDQARQRLYALDGHQPGIYGFDATSPPTFPALDAFAPLATSPVGNYPGLAVDNTDLASAGNVYMTSQSTNLLYGFTAAGVPLGGAFPIDPASSPGAPDGSPKNLCGTAVDSAGNIWVSNSSTRRILKYAASGTSLPGAIDTSAQGGPCNLAFDSNDDLYVATTTNGVWKYTAASGYTSVTQISGQIRGSYPLGGIAVDPSTHHLFVAATSTTCEGCNPPVSWVDEYDATGEFIDEFATSIPNASLHAGLVVDGSSHDVYLADSGNKKIHVFGPGLILPEVRTTAATSLGNTTATLNGMIGGQGVALDDCQFEYVSETAFRVGGFSDLSSGGSVDCSPTAASFPIDLEEHAVTAVVVGLARDTDYRFRISATNANGNTTTAGALFTTASPPIVETTGASVRTATTAQLSGRVYPHGEATSYHFEYGEQGPCDVNPCNSSPDRSAGSGNLTELVSESIDGLEPNTTYHYRVVADNGNPDGPGFGMDMTVTTRASDAPLARGHFPGPPESDRAWEQVSLAESSGNPIGFTQGVSDDGNRAVYGIFGGTPIADSGSLLSLYYAERTPSGWQTRLITPPRDEIVGAKWYGVFGPGDLSTLVTRNFGEDTGEEAEVLWRLEPNGKPTKLFEPVPPQELQFMEGTGNAGYFGVSADGRRAIALLRGGALDPAYPAASAQTNFYDVSTATPQLVSLLPGDSLASCGVESRPGVHPGSFGEIGMQASHWISGDGSRVFFPSRGDVCTHPTQLYVRDLGTEETKRISDQPISGPLCAAGFIKATDDAAFFTTNSRLSNEDTVASGCSGGNDIYRYDLGDGSLECLTCFVAGLSTDVLGTGLRDVSVADDGSRLYFRTETRLIGGAPPNGDDAIYRIDVGTGDLAYVAPADGPIGETEPTVAITSDGSRLVFKSNLPELNPLGGTDNGGVDQYYLYNDLDRSLNCVSCPQDGATPLGSPNELVSQTEPGQPNLTALAENGTFAFVTPTPLVGADQNSPASGGSSAAGRDVYEWRDGRLLLITDGLSNWTQQPGVEGISRSGRDIFFSATAQYTPDAPDALRRLYDARIGGGIEFPVPPKPCSLEVCQGTPKGAPEGASPGSSSFSGPGNAKPRATHKRKKKKKKRRGRHAKKKHARHHKANHNRRAAR